MWLIPHNLCLAEEVTSTNLWGTAGMMMVVIVAVMAGGVVVLYIRRRLFSSDTDPTAGLDSAQIDRLHDQGLLTGEEYQRARRAVLGLPMTSSTRYHRPKDSKPPGEQAPPDGPVSQAPPSEKPAPPDTNVSNGP